ncbi:MAG: HAMP domain-containing histidine kinase [Firmicutes bacterium]|nr:HAMP domain-containing histidine kinase [Bacillota bacterium]
MLGSRGNGSNDIRGQIRVLLSWVVLVILVVYTIHQHIAYSLIGGATPKSMRTKAIVISSLAIIAWYYLWQNMEGSIRRLKMKLDEQAQELMHMHEQRHDLLNELTLALMYLQSGQLEKGQQCLQYAASHVSNRVSEQGMPEDAWVQMINLKQKEAMNRGIDFHVHLTYAALENSGESHVLARLLGNLLDNALEAAAESQKPFVLIACRSCPGYRRIVIGNNGATIPVEFLEKVRQPGFSTKTGKRGYGLAISDRLARGLGGHLDINSDPHAEWTEVCIVIPSAEKVVSKVQDEVVQPTDAAIEGDTLESGLSMSGGR